MNQLKKYLLLISLIFATVSSAFYYVVNADAIKISLIAAHSNVENIILTQDNSPVIDPYYEDASYLAFLNLINGLGGVAGIQIVIDDPLAIQIDVDNLTGNINDAIAGLILDDTYLSTLANYSVANAINLTTYTSDSQILYHAELERIKDILDNPTAGETAILALNGDIDAADSILVLRGDKTAIIDKKAQIELIYGADGSNYIPSTFNAFKAFYDNLDTVLLNDLGLTLQGVLDNIDALVGDVTQVEIRLDETLSFLVPIPNKQNLIDDYNIAINIDNTLYTSSSYTAFTAGLVEIKNIIDDVESTEVVVNQALIDLTDLYDILVDIADTTSLLSAYNAALTQDLSVYTPNSISLYQNELTRINDLINSDDTDQNTANQALTDLNSAANLLILQADRSELEIMNELLIIAYYEERSLYTTSSYELFKIAVMSFGSYLYVNSVINNDNVTQTAVDNLEIQIDTALNLLVSLESNSELIAVYQQLLNRDFTEYTINSKDEYNLELSRLYDLMRSKELDTVLYNQITVDLLNVPDLLVELPDYSMLQITYNNTSIYREEDYSISSYAVLSQAKASALYTLSNLNATQEEVDSVNQQLIRAMQNLQQKQEIIYIVENDKLDIKPYITLGENTIFGYSVENSDVLSIDGQGIIQGLQYGQTKVRILLSNGATEVLDVFVKAKLNTTVYILTFSVPVLGVGLGFALIYLRKDSWSKLLLFIKNIFKKKIQK